MPMEMIEENGMTRGEAESKRRKKVTREGTQRTREVA